MNRHVLMLAGGSGVRMGVGVPKQYRLIAGRTLLTWALHGYRTFERVVVVHNVEYLAETEQSISAANMTGEVVTVPGGASRRLSLLNGMAELEKWDPGDTAPVLVHNASSPNTPLSLIDDCISRLLTAESVVTYIPVMRTTFKRENGLLVEMLDRDVLSTASDPTGYQFGLLKRIVAWMTEENELAKGTTLDIARELGAIIEALECSDYNIKITSPVDLATVKELLSHRAREGAAEATPLVDGHT